jgi:Bacterial PH domain
VHKVRFRDHAALVLGCLVTVLGSLPAVLNAWYLAPIVLLPLGLAFWAWRAGTDADRDGLTIRAAFGSRRVPWSAVAAIVPRKNRVEVILASGGRLALTGVSRRDLARLVAVSGQELTVDRGPATREARGNAPDEAAAEAQ